MRGGRASFGGFGEWKSKRGEVGGEGPGMRGG